MVKKLLNIVAVLIATGGISLAVPSLVYADSAQGASATDSQSSTTVVTDSSSEVVVTTSTSSESSVDGSSQNTSTLDEVTNDSSNIDSNNPTISDTDKTAANDTSSQATVGGDSSQGGVSGTSTSSDQPANLAEATHVKIMQAIKANTVQSDSASLANGYASSTPIAPQAAPANPSSESRSLPPAQGALAGMNGALSTIVLPQIGKFFGILGSHSSSVPLAALPAASLLVVIMLSLSSIFVEFLRRSGFHGAARGDASAAGLLFATPHKVDVIWATLPSYAPAFLVSDTQTLTNAFRKGGE